MNNNNSNNYISESVSKTKIIIKSEVEIIHGIERKCKDCGEIFFLQKDEIEFLEGKGFPYRIRCRKCAHQNKLKHNIYYNIN